MKDIWAFQNNPRAIMHQALFILNFLNLPQGDILTRAEKHFVSERSETLEPASFKEIWAKTTDAEWVLRSCW